MEQDKIRILRVIEYSGDRAAVEEHMQKVLQGEKRLTTPNGYYCIKACTVGILPEILEKGE